MLFPGNQFDAGIPCATKDASLGGLSVVVDPDRLASLMALAESLASRAGGAAAKAPDAEPELPTLLQLDISVPALNPWTKPYRVVVRCRLASMIPVPVQGGVRIGLEFLNMTTADRKTMEAVLSCIEE
jgi:hypothetical protein